MKPETKRLFAAIICTPLIIGLIGAFAGLLAEGWKMAGYFFLATCAIALVFVLAYGVPVHLILKRLGRTGVIYYLAAAVPAALIIDWLNAELLGLQVSFDAVPGGIISPLTLTLVSAGAAAIAWAIVRPDKSAAGRY